MRLVRGRPLLSWVVERLRQCCRLDQGIVVATSDRSVDDPIAQHCQEDAIACFRGSAEDVAGRVLSCAESHHLNWFARVNADSPFVDADLLDRACQIAAAGNHDLITNLSPRSFPYGVSAELVRVSRFREAYRRMWTPDHFEHVTKILYENPELCRTHNLECGDGDLSHVRLTIDTSEDWRSFSELADVASEQESLISYQEAIRIRRKLGKAA